MATVKFVTIKGQQLSAQEDPYYIALPQHERTMSRKEALAMLSERTGYSKAQIEAVFRALAKLIADNADKGFITYLDNVISCQTSVKGAFATATGPWVKGTNYLVINGVSQDGFKSILGGATLVNNTEGAQPNITSVLDKTTGEYDVITGSNTFSIAGTDLAPDTSKSDEGVTLVNDQGTVVAVGEISTSELQVVECHIDSAHLPAAGEYTLTVRTRAGLGEEFSVGVATRKVEFKVA